MMQWAQGDDAYDVLKMLHDAGYDLYDSAISEPYKRGFMALHGHERPTGMCLLLVLPLQA